MKETLGMSVAFVAIVLTFALSSVVDDCEAHRNDCVDAPLLNGCTHPDQRFTVVDGRDMCLCARDGGAK